MHDIYSVSYTHLDVYKRQLIGFMNMANTIIMNITTKKQEYGVLQAVGINPITNTHLDDGGAGGNYSGTGRLSSAAPKQVIVNIESLLSVNIYRLASIDSVIKASVFG